jgi:hypothetical protein
VPADLPGRDFILQIDDRVLHELERDLDFEELSALSAKAT